MAGLLTYSRFCCLPIRSCIVAFPSQNPYIWTYSWGHSSRFSLDSLFILDQKDRPRKPLTRQRYSLYLYLCGKLKKKIWISWRVSFMHTVRVCFSSCFRPSYRLGRDYLWNGTCSERRGVMLRAWPSLWTTSMFAFFPCMLLLVFWFGRSKSGGVLGFSCRWMFLVSLFLISKINLYIMRSWQYEPKMLQFRSVFPDSLVMGFDEVSVFHGIGTGKLAWAVKNFLKEHPSVKEFFDAPPSQGGFGAKIIRL